MANEKAYRRGFMDKLAEFSKLGAASVTWSGPSAQAPSSDPKAAREAYWAEQDKKNGIEEPEKYVPPSNFREQLAYSGRRLGKNLMSLGRGAASAAGAMGIRALQGGAKMYAWMPLLADEFIFGKALGVDEGRGLFGRYVGQLDRMADRGVHGLRRWSNDYDYKNRINGRFNRFMNGTAADTLGSFAGWGGLKALANKSLVSAGFAAWGASDALGREGQAGQLRAREAMMRRMHPRDRVYMDATSTAYNQEHAPTMDEYHMYHLPDPSTLPATYAGRMNIPYNWRHAGSAPTQFRDFGT